MPITKTSPALERTAMLPAASGPENPECGAWDAVRAGWRRVYGDFFEKGVSIETHDFEAGAELDWGRSFHRDSIELCLNFSGRGTIGFGSQEIEVAENVASLYAAAGTQLRATRSARQRQRFVTIEFSREFLAHQLAGAENAAEPIVRGAIFERRARSGVDHARPLSSAQQALASGLAEPPVHAAALPLWYEGKVLEAVATFLVAPAPEMFCTRQKRLARERSEQVKAILRARLAEPPSLEELGREVGVSQFHLSRIFAQETGLTIRRYLHRIRMERAAELLRGGGHNVTEAAFAVGYSSLGNFSKSFCEAIGCCPALYPQALNLVGR